MNKLGPVYDQEATHSPKQPDSRYMPLSRRKRANAVSLYNSSRASMTCGESLSKFRSKCWTKASNTDRVSASYFIVVARSSFGICTECGPLRKRRKSHGQHPTIDELILCAGARVLTISSKWRLKVQCQADKVDIVFDFCVFNFKLPDADTESHPQSGRKFGIVVGATTYLDIV